MAAGENRGEHERQRITFADHRDLDLVEHLDGEP